MSRQLMEFCLSRTIEVQVLNSVQTIFKFDVNETTLDTALVHGIQIISNPATLSPTNRALLNQGCLFTSFLTLINASNKILNQSLPIEALLRNPSGITIIHPKLLSIRNSYVEIPQIAAYGALPIGGASIVFTFFYKEFDSSIHRLNDIGELIS